MTPQYLKIKGLYSYQGEQEIFFDKLTEASLFGIFGSVGSGKSSILEAIMFALYGDTERLNKSGDERNYNMMNLRSTDLHIDFVCIAGSEGNRYRFVVNGRRNSKNFKDVKTFERKSYQWIDDNWMPITAEDVAEKVIGLSYENFRRTIIIPQGRFQEFIELKGRDRSEMMKELFSLEKFDLSDKTARLISENKFLLENIAGQLQSLGDINAEIIAQKEHELTLKKQQIKQQEAEIEEQRKQEKALEELNKLFKNLQETTEKLTLFRSQEAVFEQREKRLLIFEKCVLNYKSLFEQKQRKQLDLQRDKQLFENNKQIFEQKQVKQKEVLAELEKVKPYYEKREDYNLRANDYRAIILLKKLDSETAKLQERIKKGSEMLEQKEQEILKLKSSKENLEKSLENRKKEIVEQQIEAKLDDELLHLSVQKSLQRFADSLKNNEPCPLCGSVHHPAVLSSDEDFDAKIQQISQQKKAIKDELEHWQNQIKYVEKQIEESTKEKSEKFEKGLNKLKEDLAGSDGQRKTLEGQLKLLQIVDFQAKSIEELEDLEKKAKENYTKIIEKFEGLDKENRALEGDLKGIEGSQKTLKVNLENHEKELQSLSASVENQLKIDEFESVEWVEEILKQNLSIETERREIQAFQTNFKATQQAFETLSKDAKGKTYEADKHEELKQKIAFNDLIINNLRKEEGSLEKEIATLKQNFEKQQKLFADKKKLEIRRENFDTLQKLFKANGFVDFVSSIYLKNLCNAANERFHKMTRQQLHLEINQNNDFEVRDLLNGGHTRLLKTLSGGQKFQAALSLSLALADNIHAITKSKHSFFFLDEGFGSLDKEALQTVFETLKSLRKENRIVGIISHVEELQQEILTYLKITQTEDGSRISTSWQ